MADGEHSLVHIVPRIELIDAAAWDACANPDPGRHNPFLAHAFLAALESSGAVGGRTGWTPHHLALMGPGGESGAAVAVMPLYIKMHSQGEYVFDHAWAEAYQRAGGRYYPKLQAAVPFTPVPGRRLLAGAGEGMEAREELLARAAIETARQLDVSSLHVTFLTAEECARLARQGFLPRTDQQFHWENRGYGCFEDFLATLASRKRKAIRKERADAVSAGLEIELVSGAAITEAHWDAMFAFYLDTGSRKWGRPYLNRPFFSLLGAAMADRCLLAMARRQGRFVAGALHLIGGDCLYGRYWGALENHPGLHFELCYYQAIEYAIAHGLARAEAGAQGGHKLARGYLPVPTYSAHWIADPGLRRAVAHYLAAERQEVAETIAVLAEHGPYRKACEPEQE